MAGSAPMYSSCGRDAVGQGLGDAVHRRSPRSDGRATNHATPLARSCELRAAEHGRHDQHDDLERGDQRARPRGCANTISGRRDRRGQQVAAGAGLAVDDHADAGEHAVQRDQQADRADGDEAHVVEAADPSDRSRERRRDHEGEQDRREQRDEQLPRCAGAEREPASGERGERGSASGRGRGRSRRTDARVRVTVVAGHGILLR